MDEKDERMTKLWVLDNFGLSEENVVSIFLYGSRVYGTAGKNSDWDYVVVLEEGRSPDLGKVDGKADDADCMALSETAFMAKCQEHVNWCLECLYLPVEHVVYGRPAWTVPIDKKKLRSYFSWRSNHSWSKAGKKMTISKDLNVYVGKKSLWHAFRVLAFGIQIALHGHIVDYAELNKLWFEILEDPNTDWEHYKEKYKKSWNLMKSRFREVAPKVAT